MNKYIIELDENAKEVVVISLEDGDMWTETMEVEDLEQLNSDYINEHFSDLQDTAYQKGFEDGKKEAESSETIEQAKADAFNKGMLFKEEKIHEAYQRGLEDGKAVNDKGCEGCKYAGSLQGSSPCFNCFNCSNYFKNNWTAKDDKIEVGDEVNWLGDCFIVTRIFQPRNGKEQCDGIDDDGCVYHDVLIKDLEKTGKHIDIDKILEELRYDS